MLQKSKESFARIEKKIKELLLKIDESTHVDDLRFLEARIQRYLQQYRRIARVLSTKNYIRLSEYKDNTLSKQLSKPIHSCLLFKQSKQSNQPEQQRDDPAEHPEGSTES